MRKYFKKYNKVEKLERFGIMFNANYIEEDYLVWKMPKKYGKNFCAVALNIKGKIKIGSIIKECDNFKASNEYTTFHSEELKWLGILSGFLKKWGDFK